MSSPVARPLEVVCWPRGRGEPPVYWIVERNPAKPGDCFAILGPYSNRADADEGVRREVARTAGLMLRECCYCKRVLGAVPCLPQFSGLVTHGVCPDCEGTLRESLGLDKEKPMADETKHGEGCKHPPCCAHAVETVIVTEAAGLCPFHAAALARVLRLRMREFMDELGYPPSSQERTEREDPKERTH